MISVSWACDEKARKAIELGVAAYDEIVVVCMFCDISTLSSLQAILLPTVVTCSGILTVEME